MEAPPPLPSRFDLLLGTEWLENDPGGARVRLAVREELLQPAGLTHGGVFSALVESVCSHATTEAVRDEGLVAMGQSLSINFIRPITEGTIEVSARARHRGRTTWVWEAEVSDADGRICAVAQMTIAVRARR
jgi:1,4-dihydroxy-2-naphthoyl-CoA hydrolase